MCCLSDLIRVSLYVKFLYISRFVNIEKNNTTKAQLLQVRCLRNQTFLRSDVLTSFTSSQITLCVIHVYKTRHDYMFSHPNSRTTVVMSQSTAFSVFVYVRECSERRQSYSADVLGSVSQELQLTPLNASLQGRVLALSSQWPTVLNEVMSVLVRS